MVVGGLQVIIVSVHVLSVSFTPIYVGQERLSGTPSIHQFTLDYVSLRWWAGKWSLTISSKGRSHSKKNSWVIFTLFSFFSRNSDLTSTNVC